MNSNNKRIFFNFVFTYLTIILLVLVSLFPIYNSLEKAETLKSVQIISSHSQNAMKELEAAEERLFFTARNLYMDSGFKKLYYSSISSDKASVFYNMIQLQEKMKLYFQNIGNIRNIVLYLPKLNYVLTPEYLFRTRKEFYDYRQYPQEESDWLEALCMPESNLTSRHGSFTDLASGKTCSVINLFFTFPMAGDSNIPLLIMLSLDSQAIAGRFLPSEIAGQAQCVITGPDGQFLACSDLITEDPGILEIEYQVISVTGESGKENRIYLSNKFYQDIQKESLSLIFRSIGTALLAGICVSLYFAYSRSRPLENVLNIIRKSRPDHPPSLNLEDIESSVDSMVSEIRMCRDTIKSLDSTVSHNLLERVFFGEFSSEKMKDAFVQYFGPLPSSCVCVVFSGADGAPDGPSLKNRILSSLSGMEIPHYLVHIRENKVYLVLQEEAAAQEQLNLLLKNLREQIKHVVKAGLSNPFTTLEAIRKAAFRAEARLTAGFHIQGVYLFLHTHSSPASANALSIQLLDALQRALLSGSRHGADKIILELFQNLQSGRPDAVELRQIFFSLRAVYSAVINQFSLESEKKGGLVQDTVHLPNDLDEYSQSSLTNTFLKLNSAIYDYYERQLERNKKKKSASILAYVEENFRNPNLCASMIADHYHLSEKYIYQLVKDACGETLNDRIAFLRIQEGIRLLENTDMTVNAIALSCGFISSNSMYKAFMRVQGAAPSTYRKAKGI